MMKTTDRKQDENDRQITRFTSRIRRRKEKEKIKIIRE